MGFTYGQYMEVDSFRTRPLRETFSKQFPWSQIDKKTISLFRWREGAVKMFCATIIATALLTSPAVVANLRQQHGLNARAEEAGRALQGTYVRTDEESIHIVSAYAWRGDICVVFVDQGAMRIPEYNFAIFHNDAHHTFNYSIKEEEFTETCQGAAAGINLLPAVERGTGQ
jgi:hypothetical protein